MRIAQASSGNRSVSSRTSVTRGFPSVTRTSRLTGSPFGSTHGAGIAIFAKSSSIRIALAVVASFYLQIEAGDVDHLPPLEGGEEGPGGAGITALAIFGASLAPGGTAALLLREDAEIGAHAFDRSRQPIPLRTEC